MRLYLSVFYHELPDIPVDQLIWPVSSSKATIQHLIDSVLSTLSIDAVLDSDLYARQYACHKNHKISAVLRDGDEVQLVLVRDTEEDDAAPRKRRRLNSSHDEASQALILADEYSEEDSEDGEEEEAEDSETSQEEDSDSSSSESSSSSSDEDSESSEASSPASSPDNDAWEGLVSEPKEPEKTLKPAKPAKSEKLQKPANSQEPEKTEKLTKSKQSQKTQELSKSEKALKPAKSEKLEKPVEDTSAIPFEGSSRTQSRNQRRRQSKQLAHLKSTGELPANATITDLKEYEASSAQDLQARKEELLTAIASGGIDVTEEPPKPSNNRPKLDLASSNRLVFGSLGVRVPRTQQEKDATREKLSGKLKAIRQSRIDESSSLQAMQPTNWQSKLNLSAVECWDDIKLTDPPFPFKQRWDSHYNKKTKRKRSEIDNYDEDSYATEIDYGADTPTDGFPPLPEDITTLPALDKPSESDLAVFQELVCSAETNYQPAYVTQRAKILGVEGNTVRMQLAMPEVQYDEDGNRVYGKLDLPDDNADDSDDGIRTVKWSDCIEPRLLHRHEKA